MTQNQNISTEQTQLETQQVPQNNENNTQHQNSQPLRQFFEIDADEFENRKLCIAKGIWLT